MKEHSLKLQSFPRFLNDMFGLLSHSGPPRPCIKKEHHVAPVQLLDLRLIPLPPLQRRQ